MRRYHRKSQDRAIDVESEGPLPQDIPAAKDDRRLNSLLPKSYGNPSEYNRPNLPSKWARADLLSGHRRKFVKDALSDLANKVWGWTK